MWVYDPDRKCNKCDRKDTAFFAQRGKASKKDPKRKRISINNTCFRCKKIERNKRYYNYDKLHIFNKENYFMTENL